MQGAPMDHSMMFAIVERMSELGLLVMAHCYANADFEAPWRLQRLAERFPQTSFIAVDAMTSPDNLEQLLAVASVHDNVYLDLTSTVLGGAGLAGCVNRLGADRVVFGTNCYSLSDLRHIYELDALRDAGLCEAQERLIMGENAHR